MKVLDHGYVLVAGQYGDDAHFIECARQSTDGAFRGWGTAEAPGDEKLLRFLWEHKHSTPFEFGYLEIEIQAPIFVARQWHRHRTQSYSEMSARYVSMDDMPLYVPETWRKQASSNKQASEGSIDDSDNVFRDKLLTAYEACERAYEALIAAGVSREQARIALPVGTYTRFRAAACPLNWLKFLGLRMPPNAQWEMRQYAVAVSTTFQEYWPRTFALFMEGQR